MHAQEDAMRYDFRRELARYNALMHERRWPNGTYVVIKGDELHYADLSQHDAYATVFRIGGPCLCKCVGEPDVFEVYSSSV
jgi:hypothetical protein